MNNGENIILDLTQVSEELAQINQVVMDLSAATRPLLGGEYFITDGELSTLLKVSRRTLQQWRTDGIIPYYNIGGKVLYRESDVQVLLDSFYIRAYAQ